MDTFHDITNVEESVNMKQLKKAKRSALLAAVTYCLNPFREENEQNFYFCITNLETMKNKVMEKNKNVNISK